MSQNMLSCILYLDLIASTDLLALGHSFQNASAEWCRARRKWSPRYLFLRTPRRGPHVASCPNIALALLA